MNGTYSAGEDIIIPEENLSNDKKAAQDLFTYFLLPETAEESEEVRRFS